MNLGALTTTEARLAGLIASGHNDREIGARLALDETARERVLAEIYRKLGIHSRTELALMLGTFDKCHPKSGPGQGIVPPWSSPGRPRATPRCSSQVLPHRPESER